jgi:hypothetical protein
MREVLVLNLRVPNDGEVRAALSVQHYHSPDIDHQLESNEYPDGPLPGDAQLARIILEDSGSNRTSLVDRSSSGRAW